MKKLFTLVAFVATFLCATVVKADVYSDGMKQLMSLGVSLSGIDVNSLKQAYGNDGQIVDKLSDALAPYYRDNMSETEFQAMLAYMTSEKYAANAKRLAETVKASTSGVEKNLQNVVMPLMMGQTPEPVKAVECAADFKQAFDRYYQVSGVDATMAQMENSISSMLAPVLQAAPAEQREQVLTMMKKMIAYLKDNMSTLMLNAMVGNVSIAELDTASDIANQPFYPAMNKAGMAIVADLGTIVKKLMPAK